MAAISLAPSVVTAPGRDGYLVYHVMTGRIHHLNPTAALVLELCDGSRGFPEMEGALRPLVGDSTWPACRDWIKSGIAEGLFVEGSGGCGNERGPSPRWLTALASKLRDDDALLAAFVCQHRAAELAPDRPLYWYELGELAHIVGRREVAKAAYGRYLQHYPDDAEVAHLLVSLCDQPPPARVPDHCIRQLYARFSAFYEENMRGDLEYRAPELLDAAVGRAIGDGRELRIVDLGCGTGLSGQLLRPRASDLVGVDLSPEMIEHARALGAYTSLHTAEVTAYLADQTSGLFDLINACDTFIYFGDLGQVIEPAARRLKPGGILAFTVEHGDTHPFCLTDSGRFSHHPRHLSEAATIAGLSTVEMSTHVLRFEYGQPVTGLVAVLSAPFR